MRPLRLLIVSNASHRISWAFAAANLEASGAPAGLAVELEDEVVKARAVAAKLTPIPAMESADHAAAQIRDAIVAGSLRPGERLVEKQLTEQLGMSRHPVREALRILSREGFVEMRLNRGALVAELDAESILEVYEIRSALGDMALRHLLGTPNALRTVDLKHLKKLADNAIA